MSVGRVISGPNGRTDGRVAAAVAGAAGAAGIGGLSGLANDDGGVDFARFCPAGPGSAPATSAAGAPPIAAGSDAAGAAAMALASAPFKPLPRLPAPASGAPPRPLRGIITMVRDSDLPDMESVMLSTTVALK